MASVTTYTKPVNTPTRVEHTMSLPLFGGTFRRAYSNQTKRVITKSSYNRSIRAYPYAASVSPVYAYSVLVENMSQHAKQCTAMIVTHEQAEFIASLRGHRGYTAKRKAFDYAIAKMGRTYDELIEIFPDCNSKR